MTDKDKIEKEENLIIEIERSAVDENMNMQK